MSNEPVHEVPSNEANHLSEITANRRDVLKTATGIVAAAAVGGLFLTTHANAAAEEGNDMVAEQEQEREQEFLAVTNAYGPNATTVKFEEFPTNFEVLEMQFEMEVPTSTGTGGGPQLGAPRVSSLTMSKLMDKYSPKLQDALVRTRRFNSVGIRVLRDNGLMATYKLSNVYVTKHSQGFPGNSTVPEMTETFSLLFTKIEASLGGSTFSWDFVTDQP